MSRGLKDIAIIGLACRFPGGADGPDSFWDMLLAGTDAVTHVPPDRFEQRLFLHPTQGEAGKTYTFAAGTLGDVSGFDAGFFGISPREAAQMDPQQRLLLEMTWEALERGGQVLERLAGTPCAVYIGISGTDYADLRQGDPEGGDAYFMLGSTLSIAANRISYVFDLRGPSMAVDTACSSSLVALHEAVRAVQAGRAPMAIVGGMNLLLSPYPFVGFSKASMLAPYGQCRAFDKLAKGYVRAEGGGVAVLKPLATAERDGDPILAVIRGIGVNSDGRTQGISLPSAAMQEALLRQVYKEAGIAPRSLSYFEAHGTGTAVGDPIEATAISRAIGRRRPKSTPLPIGSVKSNIGHLEPASGMAGLVKAVQILRHGMIPPSLHLDEPNPDIGFGKLNLLPVAATMSLPRPGGRAIVGVNSFGFGGANAHVVLEAYSPPASPERLPIRAPATGLPLVLSARAEPALRAMAGRMADWLEQPRASAWSDIAYTAACRRSQHPYRLVLRAGDAAAAMPSLRAFADGETPAPLTSGQVLSRGAKVALMFTGNGSQWGGMGTRLLLQDPRFRAGVCQVDDIARPLCGWSILAALERPAEVIKLDDTRIAQPLLFAIQVGLLESLRGRGLEFGAVVGHSVGEVAAAFAAGALSLEQAVRVILERSTAQGRTKGQGRMLAAELGAEAAAATIAGFEGRIEIAAINSPKSVTLSGESTALVTLSERLAADNIAHRLLDLDYAFHSRAQEPIHDDLLAALAGLAPGKETLPFYSAVSGGPLAGTELDADYWWRNIRRPVRFAEATAAMARDGFQIFLEVGPHPLLQGYLRQVLQPLDLAGQPLATVSRSDDGAAALDRCIDRAFILGANLAFGRIFPAGGRVVELPSYPWQRERHWFPRTPEARGPNFTRFEGPLLGARLVPDLPVWERQIDTALLPFLADHVVGGSAILPAAAFIEIALEASQQLFGAIGGDIEELEIRRPLLLAVGESRIIRFSWSPEDCGLRIESRRRMGEEPWSVHAIGRLSKPVLPRSEPAPLRLGAEAAWIARSEHYAFTEALGFDYGPTFVVVQRVQVDGNSAIVELAAADPSPDILDECQLNPALLDGCLQGIFAILRRRLDDSELVAYVPQKVQRLQFYPGRGTPCRGEVILLDAGDRSLVARCRLRDAAGAVVADLQGLRLQRVDFSRSDRRAIALYHFEPTPLPSLRPARGAKADLPAARGAIAAAAEVASPSSDLDAVAGAFAADALIAIGGDAVVPASRAALLDRLVDLAETLAPEADDAEMAWRRAVERHPERLAELTVLGRVGRALPQALSSTDLLDVTPSPATLEHLFDTAPTTAAANDALAAAVCALVAAWPAHQRLRVLEFGAGTGGLSRRLLAALPPGRFDLVLIDAEETAATRLQAEIGDRPDVRVLRVDLAHAFDQQEGLLTQSFDLLIGAFVLHASGDVPAVLQAVTRLAAPGAPVLIAEFAPSAWIDVAFGLSADWRGGRVHSPLLSSPKLARSLEAAGLLDCQIQIVGDALIASARAQPPPVAASVSPMGAVRRTWLLLAGAVEAPIAAALEHELARFGERLVRPEALIAKAGEVDFAEPADWASLWRAFAALDGTPVGVLHLLGLGEVPETASAVLLLQQRRCWTVAAAVQGLHASGLATKPQLLLVTACALAESDHALTRPAQAPLVGLGRVLQSEAGDVSCRIIDLQPLAGDLVALAGDLATEIALGGAESEVLLGPGRRTALRLRRAPESVAAESQDDGADVVTTTAGSLEKLTWSRRPKPAPEAGEVEIAVQAAGLNFRDVMLALGALPDDVLEGGYAGPTLGMEAAGVVERVGAGVSDFAPGDPVLCFAPACFASHVVSKSYTVAKLPRGVNYAAAATIPAAFFTVYYALRQLARLERGERLLVHGAAGGVGIAALQYARHVGAEVFATAGTDEKRDFVSLLGVPGDHVLDSRSTAFADDIMRLTSGEGIDVVLNSIAGEAVHRSLSVLRPFGRFLELGKADFIANSRIGLRPFRNNMQYFGIDADQLLVERPQLAARLFGEMVALFDHGLFHPLPHRVFPREQIVEAFRHMQQSRHIGKIVVAVGAPRRPAVASAAAKRAFAIDPAACYLVTGGLGGFGLATASWLADGGACHLVLVSRRGAPADAETATAIGALQARGVMVEMQACDLTDEAAVRTLVSALADRTVPLRGIVHAAAVFDDGLVPSLTAERMRQVLGPKIAGAWALHRASAHLSLDFFVLYSSISAAIGNPGQASYAAANLFLESLAACRRAAGLPSTVVAWGPIGDAGYLTRHPEIAKSLAAKLGGKPFTAAVALAQLERLLSFDAAGGVLADVDWRKVAALLPAPAMAKFRELCTGRSEIDRAGDAIDFAALAAELGSDGLRGAIVDEVAQQVGSILRMPPDKLDVQRSIFDLGMDSLMALELRMSIAERLGVELPTMTLTQDIGILRLAEVIRDQLLGQAPGAGERADRDGASAMAQGLLSQHSEPVDAAELDVVIEQLASEPLAERARLIS
jgi:acyl transferase domain-containing protein/NAD(P)-dependent dehydrogenase (short-subunit alcohol dehydrogenase family)